MNNEQMVRGLKTVPITLADCFLRYEQHLRASSPKQADITLSQLSTAIDRFTLPGWGFAPFSGDRPTKAEQIAAQQFRQTISLEQLEHALEAQEKGFGLLQPSASSQKVYRSALKKFLYWYRQQDQRLMKAAKLTSTKFSRGHGRVRTKLLTTKRHLLPYRLKLEEMPSSLLEEINKLYQFWTQPTWENRVPKIIRPGVAQNYQDWVRGFLGWLYHHEKIPLDELNLSALVPIGTMQEINDPAALKREAREAAEQVNALGNRYIQWLVAAPPTGRGCQSPKTKAMVWSTLSFVARHQYNNETDSDTYGNSYQDIPVIKTIRVELKKLRAEVRQHEGISDESKSWLDWESVLKLTEQFRQKCVSVCFYKDLSRKLGVRGMPRSATAIAGSFQLYILFAMLTYIPPRRIGELQRLKLGKRENPSFDPRHPYLYKEDGTWIIDVTPLACKTGKTYGRQRLRLPDLVFEDGRSFYSYLGANGEFGQNRTLSLKVFSCMTYRIL